MTAKAIQDHYPDALAPGYGRGRLNPHGLPVESHRDGRRATSTFRPLPHLLPFPGFGYWGMSASLFDCVAIGTAAAASTAAEGRTLETEPDLRFVTASLHVDYLAPTPIDTPLELTGTVAEVKPNKVTVDVTLTADGRACARGRVIAPPACGPR